MKLRIQGNSLRFRLTRSEVAGLHQNGIVEETAQFSTGNKLKYRIQRGGGTVIRAELTGGTITVHVPVGEVAAWATSDEVGLNARDSDLRIALEKDFRCRTSRTEQDEPDAYPHPAERSNVS